MVTNTPETQDTDPPILTTEQARGHLMTAARTHNAEAEQVARGSLAEAKIASAINRALAVAPPLKPAQITRLSTLLRTGSQLESSDASPALAAPRDQRGGQ